MAESRERLLELLEQAPPSAGKVAAAIESDVALTLAVLRRANRDEPGSVGGVPQAVATLELTELEPLVRRVGSFAFLGGTWRPGLSPERIGFHALQTRRAAVQVGAAVSYGPGEELGTAALLHDVGKVVLADLHLDHRDPWHTGSSTPRERLAREYKNFGTDHAAVGSLALKEWGIPEIITDAVGDHDAPSATGLAAVIRLADLLAHHQQGGPVEAGQIFSAGLAVGLGREALGQVIYSLTYPLPGGTGLEPLSGSTGVEPCPLSARELEVVRGLSDGKVYKQIALELGITVSTVRNHLHRTYAKLDIADRAQAVLVAAESGWL